MGERRVADPEGLLQNRNGFFSSLLHFLALLIDADHAVDDQVAKVFRFFAELFELPCITVYIGLEDYDCDNKDEDFDLVP